MKIVLVRHTKLRGVTGLCCGRTDAEPAETFQSDAAVVRVAAAAAVNGAPFTLYTSPARRCRLLADQFDMQVIADPRLQEADFGAWEGRAWNDLPVAELQAWQADFVHKPPPGGESFAALAERAEDFLADLNRREMAPAAVIVTHAGVIRALLAPRRGLAYSEAFSLTVPHGGVFVLDNA